jgi:hypothetical protein
MVFLRIVLRSEGRVIGYDWEFEPQLARSIVDEHKRSFADDPQASAEIEEVDVEMTRSGVLQALKTFATEAEGVQDLEQTPVSPSRPRGTKARQRVQASGS